MKHASPWRRRQFTSEERAQWISRCRSSGLTQDRFAQRNGLKLGTLQRWIYLDRRSTSSKIPATVFREVRFAPLSSSGAWVAEILLPDGVTVRLSATASPLWIGSLLQAVRQAC